MARYTLKILWCLRRKIFKSIFGHFTTCMKGLRLCYAVCFYTIILIIIIIVINFDGLRNFRKITCLSHEVTYGHYRIDVFHKVFFSTSQSCVFLFKPMFNRIWCSNSCPFFEGILWRNIERFVKKRIYGKLGISELK